jgi:ABC-2 type transport system permease protein
VLAGGVLAGVFAWLGAASQDSGTGLRTLLDAGLNLVPPAIVIGGIGVLAFGSWPRRANVVVYAALAWSLLADIVGGFSGSGPASRLLLDSSVFHQMTAAPGAPPDWAANAVMAAVGIGCAVAGLIAFSRRDLKGD